MKLTALIAAGAVATAGLSQAAFAQTSTPSTDPGALLGAGITDNPSRGSSDVNGPAVGNGGQMSVSVPKAPLGKALGRGVTDNPSHGSADVNGPASGNGGNLNSAGDITPHVTQDPSHGSADVNGPATGNGGNMGSSADQP